MQTKNEPSDFGVHYDPDNPFLVLLVGWLWYSDGFNARGESTMCVHKHSAIGV